MTIEERRRAVRAHGYCTNCLALSHSTPQCSSVDVCQRCGREHHTLLHLNSVPDTRGTETRRQRERPRDPRQRPLRALPQQQRRGNRTADRQSNHRSNSESVSRRIIRQVLDDSSPNPKRIIRGVVRALERLEKKL